MGKNNLVKKMLIDVMKHNLPFTFGLLFIIFAVVFLSLIPPQLLRSIIDNCLTTESHHLLLQLSMAYLVVLIFIGLFDFLKGGMLTILGQKMIKRIRMELSQKLSRIHTTYFSKNSSGTITSRLTTDVDNINSLFADGIIGMCIDCFKVIGIIVSIWMFSTRLGVLSLCLVPVIFVITRGFQKRMLKAQIRNLSQLAKVNNHIAESLKNVRMIKSFHKEHYMESLYGRELEENYKTIERVNFYDSCYAPIIQFIRAVVISLIVLLSSSHMNLLSISVGMLAASIDLFSNLFQPIESLGMELQNIQKGLSGIRRVNDFYMEEEEPLKNLAFTGNKILPNQSCAKLSFENVSFSYDENTPVLHNLTLNIPAQTSTAFVGRTGVGKTTLFRLIMGLLQPSQGQITLNGIAVYDIPNSEKRKIFGYVEQQFSFIPGTVAQQISLGDETICRAMIEDSLRFVGLEETVASLEQGLDTNIVGEGGFSQGQKQLLAIARAIVANPTILLLDEITANMDTLTEERVVTVLKKAQKGRTVLSVSHRLGAMLGSNLIVHLEDGELRYAGTPMEIIEQDPWFRETLQLEENKWEAV